MFVSTLTIFFSLNKNQAKGLFIGYNFKYNIKENFKQRTKLLPKAILNPWMIVWCIWNENTNNKILNKNDVIKMFSAVWELDIGKSQIFLISWNSINFFFFFLLIHTPEAKQSVISPFLLYWKNEKNCQNCGTQR